MMQSGPSLDTVNINDEQPNCQNCSKTSCNRTLDIVPLDEYSETFPAENASNQLVLYDPTINDAVVEARPGVDPTKFGATSFPSFPVSDSSTKVLPSIGVYTVQCANCMKWRLVPSKEKYEEIRESFLEKPFYCERAYEWHSNVRCADPPDIMPDGSTLWAIDKPNIAQPPPGWERVMRIRGEGGIRFADIYYISPSGKRLRSRVEIQKYLLKHPEYMNGGTDMSKFSFKIPSPLQENYVRKRCPQGVNANSHTHRGRRPRPLQPTEVDPLSWMDPATPPALQIGPANISTTPAELSSPAKPIPVRKKKSTKSKAAKTNTISDDTASPSNTRSNNSAPQAVTPSSSEPPVKKKRKVKALKPCVEQLNPPVKKKKVKALKPSAEQFNQSGLHVSPSIKIEEAYDPHQAFCRTIKSKRDSCFTVHQD